MFKYSRISIILLNIFFLVKNEIDEDISLRAFTCYNIINKLYKGKDEKPSVNSPVMLACFLKISEEQSQKILTSMESDEIPLEQDEIDNLTGVEILNEISQEELAEKTQQLEEALKDFQKYDKDFDSREELGDNYNYGDYDDYNDYGMNNGEYNYNDDDVNYNDYYNNDDYNNEENSSLMKEIFVENRNVCILIAVCIIIFILVLIFGKDYDENEKNKNE
jgi:hypothetical protein